MVKERTAEEVYDNLVTQGLYEEANFDKDEIKKILELSLEDYKFGKSLTKLKEPNWRIIFNIHYDVLRELCSLLLRFKKQKISNHQGLFAFIILNYPKLDLDWTFFETIRNIRNKNKYIGLDIPKETWKKVKFQMDLYISTINKHLNQEL